MCGHHACFHRGHQEQPSSKHTVEGIFPSNDGYRAGMPPPGAKISRSDNLGARREATKSQDRKKSFRHATHAVRGSTGSHARRLSPRPRSPSSQRSLGVAKAGPTGLGLYIAQTRDQHVGDKITAAAKYAADQLPPTRTPSRATGQGVSQRSEGIQASPARIFSDHVRSQALGLTVPSGPPPPLIHPYDQAQSATEIATPSNSGTPALAGADDALQHVKSGVDELHEDVARFNNSPTSPRLDSRAGSQQAEKEQRELCELQPFERRNDVGPGQRDSPTIGNLISHVISLRNMLANTPNLGMSLASLGQRVDALETASFAHSSVEELNDKFDHFDGRILDIESRVDELEKVTKDLIDSSDAATLIESFGLDHNNIRMTERLQGRPGEIGTGPTPLVDLRGLSSAYQTRATAIERLQGIEHRLAHIAAQTDISFCLPMEIEVVYLPWGPNLKGLWHEAGSNTVSSIPVTQPSEGLAIGMDEPSSHGYAQHSVAGNVNCIPLAEFEEWSHFTLTPKAVGPSSGITGRVYERLKSRGCVRNITLEDASARHVWRSIWNNFGDLLANTDSASTLKAESSAFSSLLGLQSPFVPLRKIHKHSRLRFLSESELATPALWTLSFLKSGVFMKAPSAGLTRLYITSPMAYLQSTGSVGWTWQRLRELPRVSPNSAGKELASHDNGVEEADAMEPCWEYDSKIDPPPSNQGSFASNAALPQNLNASFDNSHHPSPPPTKPELSQNEVVPNNANEARSEPSFDEFSSEPSDSQAQQSHFAPITPMSELPTSSRPSIAQRRTTSLPTTDPALSTSMPHITVLDQPRPKRQVASFDQAFTARSFPKAIKSGARPLSALSKRRRLSRTPSGRDLNGEAGAPWTPRRSSGLGSPEHDGYNEEGRAEEERLATKLPPKGRSQAVGAYATPYSWSGPGRPVEPGDTDVEMSDDSSANDEDFESEDDSEEESEDGDPAFKDDLPRSFESEVEKDNAIMEFEEAWEGVGDDSGSDAELGFLRSKRKRVGHNRRKTGPRRKVSLQDIAMNDEDEDVEIEEHMDLEDDRTAGERVDAANDHEDDKDDEPSDDEAFAAEDDENDDEEGEEDEGDEDDEANVLET